MRVAIKMLVFIHYAWILAVHDRVAINCGRKLLAGSVDCNSKAEGIATIGFRMVWLARAK